MTLTCSHGGVEVKMKYKLQIYIVPSVDWYWRLVFETGIGEIGRVVLEENRTKTTPGQKKIIWDGRTDDRGHYYCHSVNDVLYYNEDRHLLWKVNDGLTAQTFTVAGWMPEQIFVIWTGKWNAFILHLQMSALHGVAEQTNKPQVLKYFSKNMSQYKAMQHWIFQWFIMGFTYKTRLLGRPQPQMYPPVALNQYTLVNRTHKHYIYICFKAPQTS